MAQMMLRTRARLTVGKDRVRVSTTFSASYKVCVRNWREERARGGEILARLVAMLASRARQEGRRMDRGNRGRLGRTRLVNERALERALGVRLAAGVLGPPGVAGEPTNAMNEKLGASSER